MGLKSVFRWTRRNDWQKHCWPNQKLNLSALVLVIVYASKLDFAYMGTISMIPQPSTNLLWTIPKSRRADANFVGAEKILAQIADKKQVKRKRIGFVGKGPPPRSDDQNLQ